MTITALVLADSENGRFVGRDLTEHAALTAKAAGIDSVHIVYSRLPDQDLLRRLQREGLTVTCAHRWSTPLGSAPRDRHIVVIPARTVIEPRAIQALTADAQRRDAGAVVLVDEAAHPKRRFLRVTDGVVESAFTDGNAASLDVAILSPEALEEVRNAGDLRAAFGRLANSRRLRALSIGSRFCERLLQDTKVSRIEWRYARHRAMRLIAPWTARQCAIG